MPEINPATPETVNQVSNGVWNLIPKFDLSLAGVTGFIKENIVLILLAIALIWAIRKIMKLLEEKKAGFQTENYVKLWADQQKEYESFNKTPFKKLKRGNFLIGKIKSYKEVKDEIEFEDYDGKQTIREVDVAIITTSDVLVHFKKIGFIPEIILPKPFKTRIWSVPITAIRQKYHNEIRLFYDVSIDNFDRYMIVEYGETDDARVNVSQRKYKFLHEMSTNAFANNMKQVEGYVPQYSHTEQMEFIRAEAERMKREPRYAKLK